MSGKNVTWGKLLASRGLSPSQAKPSPPGRLGLGLEESEAKSRGFQAQAGASKPSQAVTSLTPSPQGSSLDCGPAKLLVTAAHFELELSSRYPQQALREASLPASDFSEDFGTVPSSFRWQDCPAYWSLDPSGVHRLSLARATQLGFPHFRFATQVYGCCWDASVYEGLRNFPAQKVSIQTVWTFPGIWAIRFINCRPKAIRRLPMSEASDSKGVVRDLSILNLNPTDAEVSSSYSAEDGHDSVESVGTECAASDSLSAEDLDGDIQESLASAFSSPGEEISGPFTLQDEMLSPSATFKFLMNVQLALILFLGLYWLYEQV
ncbi:hypothetical protein DFH08DRAFT_820388 [Mycena albidolilacea]|uniref:Uncharacterized protein n=1 Tax=Mycena albidolilacea TaxID=1033008 RepID=A0AAD7EE93_9AGAR|nr:hypothetical protein DFH08DRAFT_820388 [Mycena albidolilacea]